MKYLADSGAHSATFFETIGWKGIMDADDLSSRPKTFRSRPRALFPVYHFLHEIGEFKGGTVRGVHTSDNLSAVGLALKKQNRTRILVGNLTGRSQTVTLRGISGRPITVQILGAKTTRRVPELTIDLPPYGIARIDRVVD